MNSRDRILSLIEGRPIDRVPLMPITMMFAADQIGVKYLQYVTDYRVLVEAQLRTAERFELDFVSCISDPARECADMGARIRFFEDQPPAFVESEALLADKATLAKLNIPDPLAGRRMHDRVMAAALLKERAGSDKVVEGWIEGPCGMAANLRGINTLMLDFYDDPPFVSDLLAFTTEVGIAFARAQRQAGVDLMGVGDPASSLIGRALFENVVAPWHIKLVAAMRGTGLKTRSHICGNTSKICEARSRLGYDIVDIDSQVSPELAREKMGPRQIILGNVPTVAVMEKGSPDYVRRAAEACHRVLGEKFILGAGCEVPRTTPAANMDALCEYAHRGSVCNSIATSV